MGDIRNVVNGLKLLLYVLNAVVLSFSVTTMLHAKSSHQHNTYTTGTLANGMSYHFLHVPSEPKRVDVRLFVGVGASDENAGEQGVAHMVEHMAFKRAVDYPTGVGQTLMDAGWKRGRHFNAMTNYERTLYMFSPPKGTKQLPQTLKALSAIVSHRDFDAKAWDDEREIIMGEWRSGRGLSERMNRKRAKVIRSGSRQARYSILGTVDSIQNLPVSTLQQFHQRWYAPNNMKLMISGDFDKTKTLALIKDYFGKFSSQPLPERTGDYYEPKLVNGWHVAQLQDKESGHSQVALIFRVDDNASRAQTEAGSRERQIDRFASKILSQRLKNQVPALPKSVSNVVLRKRDIGRRTVALGMFASVAPDAHNDALNVLLKLRQQLLDTPVTQAEFDTYKEKYLKVVDKAKGKTTLPEPFGDAIMLVSTKVFNDQPVRTQAQIAKVAEKTLKTVTVADINARMQEWLNATDKLVQMQAPALTPIKLPTNAQVAQQADDWAQQAQAGKLPALLAKKEYGEGRFVDFASKDISDAAARDYIVAITQDAQFNAARPPQSALKESDKKRGDAKVSHWLLKNGDKVVLLQTPLADGRSYYKSIAPIGFLNKQLNPWQAQLAAQIIWQSAPQGWQPAQLNQWKSQHKFGLSEQVKARKTQVEGSVKNANLDKLLHLYYAYQVTPQVGDDYRDAIMPLIRKIPMRSTTPRAKKQDAITQLRYRKASYVEPTQKQLENTEKADLLKQWQTLSQVPVTHYLVTDMPTAQLRPLLGKYLGSISRKTDNDSAIQQSGQARYNALAGQKTQHIYIGIEADRSEVIVWSWTAQPWRAAEAMRVAMLGDIAYEQLKAELRDKQLGVYSLRFDSTLNPDNGRIESVLRFNSKPERADELWQLAGQVMQKLPEAITKEKVAALKTELTKAEQSRLKNPRTWLNRLILSTTHHGDARYLSTMTDLPEELTLEKLKQTATRLWSDDNRRVLVVNPEQSAK